MTEPRAPRIILFPLRPLGPLCPQQTSRSGIAWGALLWLCLPLIFILLRGVRWDENYEFAQVILGQVPYPPDHPLALYTHSFFSLQTWSLAGLMRFFPGPLLANTLRNLFFLWATALPPYLLASCWTGRARWGHAAALVLLMGIHSPFYSNYPVQIWPDLYSNGHVGLGWMLLSLYFLVAKKPRLAWTFFGLAPAIHLGQFPPLLALFSLRLIWICYHREFKELRIAASWGLGALLATLIFAAFVHWNALTIPESGPFSAAIAPAKVFKGYMTHHASHRSIPRGTGHIAVFATLLISLLFLWQNRRIKGHQAIWPAAYIGITLLSLWAILGIHLFLGPNIPYLFISWMPYRLMNHLSPLLIPMLIAILVGKEEKGSGAWIVIGALAYGILRPFLALLLPEALFLRYIATGEAVYFGLCGAAIMTMSSSEDKKLHRIRFVLVLISSLVLALFHQFGAACLLAGALLYLSSARLRDYPPPRTLILAICLALLTVFAVQEYQTREHLPVSSFEKSVRRYLKEAGEENAMIAARYQQEGLQARLHHPLMTDMATMTWIPYKPTLGPGLYALYRDLYGLNFAPSKGQPARPTPWFTVWPAKAQEEWLRLSRRYGFHYLITPAFMELDLPCVLEEEGRKLYRIPSLRDRAQ